ncbi:MAG: glycogen/starch/alpha-glucan family phosphorylase, partial [Firmicutes bacterium]|nr:glycogen/starch/alpha-glucan family phosphorylase [Bacillota bacterium]
KLIPRVYMIIEEIDNRWRATIPAGDNFREIHKRTAVLWGGEARMANLSIIGSHSVNGVAVIHSEILKNDVFKEFYQLQPWKFSNKTNGVSPRRFLMQANPALTSLITSRIGEGWKTDLSQLERLKSYMDDESFLFELANVKKQNKERLAAYIDEKQHIAIDTESVMDVHVKRIHAYKRQLLTAFKILNLYNRIKADPNYDIYPVTFVVGGKAAPGYDLAKEIIKFICSIADKVNSDPEVSKKMKVVFIENFSLSNAQVIYPAADISEQVSTAGKEASGTGNMKFMMNGAVTLGTMDGANIEIFERCGYENAKVFGLKADEAAALSASGEYSAINEIAADPELKMMVNQLVDGTFDECGQSFWRIYDSLINENDQYFVLRDFPAYFKAWEELVQSYKDKKRWQQMALANISGSGFFSSDRTISEYAKEVWGL